MTKRTKKNLKKVIRKIPILLIGLITIVLVLISLGPTQAKSSTGADYQVVVVREGETLWKIAKKHTVNGDIREFIHQMKKLNNLEHSVIYPGQKLIVPNGE